MSRKSVGSRRRSLRRRLRQLSEEYNVDVSLLLQSVDSGFSIIPDVEDMALQAWEFADVSRRGQMTYGRMLNILRDAYYYERKALADG